MKQVWVYKNGSVLRVANGVFIGRYWKTGPFTEKTFQSKQEAINWILEMLS